MIQDLCQSWEYKNQAQMLRLGKLRLGVIIGKLHLGVTLFRGSDAFLFKLYERSFLASSTLLS